MTRALACVAVVASGCATYRPFVCPAQGGPTWREVSSEHFVLRTDLDEGPATAMVRDLEQSRAAMLAIVIGHDVATHGRVEVVAFRTLGELMPFSQHPDIRAFVFGGELGERHVALAESWDTPTRRLLAHEVAHVVTAYAVPRQPRWYAEGLASFLEGIGERPLVGGRAFGGPPPGTELGAAAARVPVRDVLQWREARQLPENLYAGSFALIHYLFTQRHAGFDALTARLAGLEAPSEAWDASFPEWGLDAPGGTERLDAELRRYVRSSFATFPAPAGTDADVPVKIRPMSAPEVHTIRLGLPHRWVPEAEAAEIAEALAEDPGHVASLASKAGRGEGDALALARKAVAAHPEDPAAWELLAANLPKDARGERRDALRRAVELSPHRVRALLLLGAELGTEGEAEEAATYTRRALDVAPWSSSALLLHGMALANLGRCEEAVALGRRAFDVTLHAAYDARRAIRGGSDAIEARCRGRSPADEPPRPRARPAAGKGT